MNVKIIIVSLFLSLMTVFTSNAQKKVAVFVHQTTFDGGIQQGYDKESADRFMEAFEDCEVTFIPAGASAQTEIQLNNLFGAYDLIVIHPTVAGDNTHLGSLKTLVGKKPILNLKSFCYQAGRWNWTDANAQNSTNTNINYITVEKDVQNHPIFPDFDT